MYSARQLASVFVLLYQYSKYFCASKGESLHIHLRLARFAQHVCQYVYFCIQLRTEVHILTHLRLARFATTMSVVNTERKSPSQITVCRPTAESACVLLY
jgi:hypothetical protein